MMSNFEESTGLLSDLDEGDVLSNSTPNISRIEASENESAKEITESGDINDIIEQDEIKALGTPELKRSNLETGNEAEDEENGSQKRTFDENGKLGEAIEYPSNTEEEQPREVWDHTSHEGEISDDEQGEHQDDVHDDNDNDNDDYGDVELIGSRQISVVEIDSEDEIENLEETEALTKEVKGSPGIHDRAPSFQSPIIVEAGEAKYLLVAESEDADEFSDLQWLFEREQIESWLLFDFLNALRQSDVFEDLKPRNEEDLLNVSFDNLLTVTQGDHRTSDLDLTEVLLTTQKYVTKRSKDDNPLTLTLSLDESPLALFDRLSREVGRKRSVSMEEERNVKQLRHSLES